MLISLLRFWDFLDMPNPKPFDTFTQMLENDKDIEVVQIWVDDSNASESNHFCLIKKPEDG
ncbi:hypothetical protein V6Z05_04200 [Leptospira venezuelensis]|uniref:hypothetical protein n=1 Tax=Leptospira venezuelensis TaxID=1958811 RepID=UPI000A35F974|nr:hypothetical protein [Leptospira venezuelensis]